VITSNYIRGLGAAIVLATQFMGTAHASIAGHEVSALVPYYIDFDVCQSTAETSLPCYHVHEIDHYDGTYATVGGASQSYGYFSATFTDTQITVQGNEAISDFYFELRDHTTGRFIPVTFESVYEGPYSVNKIAYEPSYTRVWATIAGGGQLVLNIGGAVSPVPEPSTAAMSIAGLALLGFMARRRKSK
jgi:hypothetical protein